MVEPLSVMAALTVEPAYASSPYGRAPKGPYGRAPKGPMVERLRSLSVESLTYSFYLLAPQIKSKKGRVT
jgi:hypothetical protein